MRAPSLPRSLPARLLAPAAAGTASRATTLLLAAGLVLASCAPAEGPSGPPAAATGTSASPAGSGSVACDTSNLPGWPKPGQVTTTGLVPVLASSQLVAGRSRFLFTVVDAKNKPVVDPAIIATLAFYDLCADPDTPAETLTAPFTWGIEGVRGYYVAEPTFARAGPWGVAIVFTRPDQTQGGGKVQFSVRAAGTTPALGAQAPSVRTPTLADVGGEVRQISSDPSPNPDFYRESVDAALAAHEPFVLAFATPAFCLSTQCGPTLDLIKEAAATGPAIRVINVEPYQLTFDGTRLQPVRDAQGALQPVEATRAYGLPTEPWVFVVDRQGRVVGSFEAVLSIDELRQAIAAALSS